MGNEKTLNWIENQLLQLSTAAWSPKNILGNNEFLLKPGRILGKGVNYDHIVSTLYAHAREWAPGFEIPFSIPSVRFKPFIDKAGTYSVDDKSINIELSTDLILYPDASISVLCHEICHHILDLSGLNTRNKHDDEARTDIAIFICGFGELFLQGQGKLQMVSERLHNVHYGYLKPEQYKYVHNWVLKSKNINKQGNLFNLIKDYVMSLFGKKDNVVISNVEVLGESIYLRKKALGMLSGNNSTLENLIGYERKKLPGLSDVELLKSVISSIERDRR